MALPTIAIVGRPNVGKSTLFNRIAGERISIVEDVEGVTRDRIYATAEWLNRKFSIIDTGGIDDVDAPFMEQIKHQAEIAMDEADVIVFVVSGKEGDTVVDSFPHIFRHADIVILTGALIFHSGTLCSFQTSLQNPQDITHGNLCCRSSQPVTTTGTSGTIHQTSLLKLRHKLLQIAV